MIKNKRNIILAFILVAVMFWGLRTFFYKDTYIGFYYPDENNLINDIQSANTFVSLDACRDWIEEQVSIYNQGDVNYDYECGKNCDISGNKPYVCEETLR